MSKKLIRIDMEEQKRKASGLSGYRRLLFYADYEAQLIDENRLSEKKGGDRVVSAMQEDGLDTGSSEYQTETISRYQGRNHPYPIQMAILDRLGVRSLLAWVTPHRRQSLIAWAGDPLHCDS